ncbi:CPS_collapsed_G0017030.mRNA.1.CDS.1 [Saccharomyces cerevisiae]|nr:CPS_collapsed_G0017030.mRNA.1.CDS.1 [Saccharomyces cerevisiae]
MDASNLVIVFSMSFINQEYLANSMGSRLGAVQTIPRFLLRTKMIISSKTIFVVNGYNHC